MVIQVPRGSFHGARMGTSIHLTPDRLQERCLGRPDDNTSATFGDPCHGHRWTLSRYRGTTADGISGNKIRN